MAANDEFPRGWTISSSPGAGANVNLLIPACPGITRILDAFVLIVLSGAAGSSSGIGTLLLSSSGGTFAGYPLTLWGESGGTVGVAELFSGTDLKLSGAPGESLTLTSNNPPPANIYFDLTVQGHDI